MELSSSSKSPRQKRVCHILKRFQVINQLLFYDFQVKENQVLCTGSTTVSVRTIKFCCMYIVYTKYTGWFICSWFLPLRVLVAARSNLLFSFSFFLKKRAFLINRKANDNNLDWKSAFFEKEWKRKKEIWANCYEHTER